MKNLEWILIRFRNFIPLYNGSYTNLFSTHHAWDQTTKLKYCYSVLESIQIKTSFLNGMKL